MNRCSYAGGSDEINSGYFYQQVFSCRTCYEDLVKEKLENQGKKELEAAEKEIEKKRASSSTDLCGGQPEKDEFTEAMKFVKMTTEEQDAFLEKITNRDIRDKYGIKPHGFCLGCMLVCHEGHDVNELYSKLDFRCDCGNSRFPKSCELNNEKDYENNKNVYNQTFYDLYCHCHMPHNQELIDEQKVSLILHYNINMQFLIDVHAPMLPVRRLVPQHAPLPERDVHVHRRQLSAHMSQVPWQGGQTSGCNGV